MTSRGGPQVDADVHVNVNVDAHVHVNIHHLYACVDARVL